MASEPDASGAAWVICLDVYRRVLLVRWCDPGDGKVYWQPPGADVRAWETPRTAAGRALWTQTGLLLRLVNHLQVSDLAGADKYFLARLVTSHEVQQSTSAKQPRSTVLEARWLTWNEILVLCETVRPATLGDVLTALDPEGPWNPEPPWSGDPP